MRVSNGPVTRRRGDAAIAPMPLEPGICRWCRGQLKALFAGDAATYCPAGCASNDRIPYLGHCDECHRDFHTGKRGALLCHECDEQTRAQITEQSRIHSATRNCSTEFGDWRRRS